ncbi:MAG TPA: asparagine synthase (glutamine-hydrolyzing) [Candidatus Udaeobacter sp.]|jgi:asparagine synthase (glutamine-hydrolysing)|nr:asparagine synthase (glutamine-hydrolyzing) [Candidatus Udaeobacter sp.]
MCGIAGVLDLSGRVDLGRLHQMSRLLRHRGPDDEGIVLIDPDGPAHALGGADTPREVYASGLRYAPGRDAVVDSNARYRVGLLSRRLAIVDLSPAGHGPLSDPSGRWWITYNGEVYNWIELRRELEAMGESFQSHTDPEVVLAAYRRWGAKSLDRLNGMFAFAIWDAEKRELFCARDRFGVKPFYYQFDGRAFAFASEPKALVLTQPRRIAARTSAIRDLLALDWVDHEAHTFFEDLWQLPPGHFLTAGERGLAVHRWWTLDPNRHAAGDRDEWTREFVRLFDDSVRLRLRADVPVGSCLSGGLDSTAVVTTAARGVPGPFHAFSCSYDEGPRWDERPYMRAAIEASGATAHLVVPDGSDFWSTFDRLARQQDEPTAGPGLYSQWKVMELAHGAGLKVLLDGQGGDETLAGYARYLPLRLRDHLAAGDLGSFTRDFGPVAEKLGAVHTLALTLEPWLPGALFRPLRRRFGQGKDRVLANDLRRLDGSRPPRAPREFGTAVRNQQVFDITQRLLPSLLRYEDRNSMAFSIETRLPFLDYRLVEFVLSLPDDQRLEGTTSKAILRRALADRLPQTVRARRDKMGFETPTDVWLRGRYAAEVRRRLGADGPLQSWIKPDALKAELDEYLEGRRDIGLQVWRWLSLESWARQYLAGDPRMIERAPEALLHAGRHRTFVEVERELEREKQPQAANGARVA